MKKRFVKLLIAAVLLLTIPVSLLLTGAAMPRLYGDTYYAVLERMHTRLETAEGKRIILVGGSNVAFGLDGALLEELLAREGYAYTVCPLGMYAAVGTSAMLDLSEDDLRPGDIVVLAVEPVSEAMSAYFGAGAFWKCAEADASLLAQVSREKQGALAGGYVDYLQQRRAILDSGVLPAGQGAYAADAFDARCDMVYPRAGNAMALGYDTTVPVDLGAVAVDGAFSEQVSEYCARAARRGAAVVMSFSPVNRAALTDGSDGAVAAYFDTCNAAFDCPVISDPNRYILDSGWFFDSNFHLNSAGARLRTCLLAEDLLAWLGCYRAVEYPLPEMPDPIVSVQTDETDPSLFEFTPAGGGYLVSGLTAAGLERTALRVPASFQGGSVIGFTPDALAGAAQLEELRLPGSIESLPEGLFAPAESLRRLVLAHRDSVCAVTAETFRDADQVEIYVPEAAYPMYRDGYGCETNPWEPLLERIHPDPQV